MSKKWPFSIFSSSSEANAAKVKPGTDKNNNDDTTRTVALALLWTFIASLGLLFATNITSHFFITPKDEAEFRKDWFELLKNATILLGTALTTVIGYYFGQREGSLKTKQATEAIKQNNLITDQAIKETLSERDQAVKKDVTKNSDSPDDDASPISGEDSEIIVPQ